MITTVLFDADGVLQSLPLDWPAHIVALTGASSWAEIDEVERPLMTGGDPAEAFTTRFPHRTVPVDEIIEAWNDAVIDARALPLLDQLRDQGIRCFLASNQQQRRAAWMRAETPLPQHLDGLFFSCELGLAKPDPAYFQAIVDATGANPAETLFIDDVLANVEGARSIGLHAAHHPRVRGADQLAEILRSYDLL